MTIDKWPVFLQTSSSIIGRLCSCIAQYLQSPPGTCCPQTTKSNAGIYHVDSVFLHARLNTKNFPRA